MQKKITTSFKKLFKIGFFPEFPFASESSFLGIKIQRFDTFFKTKYSKTETSTKLSFV